MSDMRTFQGSPKLVLYGFSPDTPEEIFSRVAHGAKPSSLKGDFILVAEGVDARTGDSLIVFVSTVIAAIPYYYTITAGRCVHAPDVFTCCQQAKLSWTWDWEAVADLALFDHVIGDRSLHAAIHRIPAASVVTICGNTVQSETEPFWTTLYQNLRYDARSENAANVVMDILSEVPASQPIALSLSAGYDSRVLLAALTHQQRDVQTATMGDSQATDARIAQQLATSVHDPFTRVELTPDDYVRNAREILTCTSGEKVFTHWHTGIYANRAPFTSSQLHIAGSNGEFARSTLCDKGMFAQALDAFPILNWQTWITRQHQAQNWIVPDLVRALGTQTPFARALNAKTLLREVPVGEYCFGDGLDVFYATQRVRNFIGLGVALYRNHWPTMSPFLDARFITYSAHLPRHEKLANRLPRKIIQQLQPKLLDFPTDERGVPMRVKPSLIYFRKHAQVRGYQQYRAAQALPQVQQWARAGYQVLSGGQKEYVPDQAYQWNFGITIGAILDVLQEKGISLSSSTL